MEWSLLVTLQEWCLLLTRHPEFLIPSLVTLFIFFLLHRRISQSGCNFAVNWPILGMLPTIIANHHRLHDHVTSLLQQSKHTFMFKVPWLTGMDILITCDPGNANHMFNANFSNYPKGEEFSEILDILGDGILSVDGDLWMVQRRMAHAHMSDPRFRSLVATCTRNKVGKVLLPLLNHIAGSDKVVDLSDVLLRFTFDTTCTFVYGIDPSSLAPNFPTVPFAEATHIAEQQVVYRHITPMVWWKLLRYLRVGKEREMAEAMEVVDHFIAQIIRERRECLAIDNNEERCTGEASFDMLTAFMDSKSSKSNDKFLRDMLLAFLVAGKDSTGSAMAWFLWLVSNNPHVEKKILEELRCSTEHSSLDAEMVVFDAEKIDTLVYLHAAVCESQRLYPALRNHVHLTNCIHLKNHMHRHSPILSERSLMRDLVMLQRSRSLRDPSASPPSSWISPSVASTLGWKAAKDGSVHSGRRSVGVDRRRESGAGRLSVRSSGAAPSVATSKVVAAETSNVDEEICKGKEDGSRAHNSRGKTLSEQLEEAPSQTDNESRRNSGQCSHRKEKMEENIAEEPEVSGHVYCTGLKQMRRRRFKGTRRARGSVDLRGVGTHNGQAVDSKWVAQGPAQGKQIMGDGRGEDTEMEVNRAPGNGCGIPWNWSRIHNRGKSFLDIAGRSLSCGLSDPRLRKTEGSRSQGQKDTSRMPIASDHLTSSTDSDSEALPLLIEVPGSQESNRDHFLVQDYSGELGIYANDSSRHELDSDLESEARSGSRHKSKGAPLGRHQSLGQKYMPKTFKDLVGQNLVVQALSNAVLRRKVGLIYVFYGPHGTGKTSCARVFAKALNCQSMDHPRPCDVCTSCISHNLGKSRNVMEVGPVSAFEYENIMDDVLDKALLSPLSSQYRVFIIDDCDTLPPDSWSAISKVIDRAPQHAVFVLISSSLDHLPHIIISRCQKFFFPKLKDADIIYMLQWIATSEGLQIDKDALKLIASRSDGSLRDAEMTLDQLSLLGQRISLPLVQELVGLVSDEKLVDLLDLALSADTVNTVKGLREIMETGVEPLALMSQLATIITDILAGSYVFTREKLRRNFFRRLTLSKEDMEKLRQALKTLSEAEKQLRLSNDKLTWLTAALLQLAPNQQYTLPTSSAHTSLNHSPVVVNNIGERDMPRNFVNEREELLSRDKGISRETGPRGTNGVIHGNSNIISSYLRGKKIAGHAVESPMRSIDITNPNGVYKSMGSRKDYEKIWRLVLENIQSDTLKHFLFQEGKMGSVCFGAAPTVQLIFNSTTNKAKAEKFRGQILQAFESTLLSEVILEIRCESRKDMGHIPLDVVESDNGSQMTWKHHSLANQRAHCSGSENLMKRFPKENVQGIGSSHVRRIHNVAHGEITEIVASPQENAETGRANGIEELKEHSLENVWLDEASSLQHQGSMVLSQSRGSEEQRRRHSLVRGKLSLAHVIQQADAQGGVWSRRKAISIAEKLEQENLRLEPMSRSLICWRVPRIPRRKLPHLRTRTRKPRYLLKMVTCGRCLS